MERKIGEVFEYEGKALRVEEYKENVNECFGCFFDGKCFSLNAVGHCEAERRTDKKNVIFVEVKEETKEQQQEEQKLNLCEILKHCPKGEKFWSPMFGYVVYRGIIKGDVGVTVESGVPMIINADGTLTINFVTSPEVMLYPSREQRDWTKVKYEKKKEKFDPKTLNAFDKVLVRSENIFDWNCSLFSNINDFSSKYPFSCLGTCYRFCIPYNDETKHLVGTKEDAPEFYKYWED